MATTIKMRVNVAGFASEPASIFAAYSADTDILLVLRDAPYEDGLREGFLHITTQTGDRTHDAVFDQDQFREAIVAYFESASMSKLSMSDTMGRHDPRNAIQRNGVDEKGPKYQIQPTITNGQVAVLVACFYARHQRALASSRESE